MGLFFPKDSGHPRLRDHGGPYFGLLRDDFEKKTGRF